MPGLITHLLAGCGLIALGRFSFKKYFNNEHKTKKQLLLIATCLSFSLLPDFFLGIYYTTHILPFKVLNPLHVFSHQFIAPTVAFILLGLILADSKRRPIWIMGLLSIILHLTMDCFIPETGPLW